MCRGLTPLVHQELGCKPFALHTDGDNVFMSSAGSPPRTSRRIWPPPNLRRIRDLLKPLLAASAEAWRVEGVSLGDPGKDVVQ
ncbi:hypothetical protein ACWGQ5_50760 [Streptomyces sp. NPDC055722]